MADKRPYSNRKAGHLIGHLITIEYFETDQIFLLIKLSACLHDPNFSLFMLQFPSYMFYVLIVIKMIVEVTFAGWRTFIY